MKHTLEAVRKLLKEKTSDAYAFKSGVICLDTFAGLALLYLVEKELDSVTSQSRQSLDSSPQGEP